MQTSSKFFNKSFIYFEAASPPRQNEQISLLKNKHYIEPWRDNQNNVIKAFQHQKQQEHKLNKQHSYKIKHYSFRLPSNLLHSNLNKPKDQSIPFMNIQKKPSHFQLQRKQQKLPYLQKMRDHCAQKIKSLSIKQFIDQQKKQLGQEQQNKKYQSKINEQNQNQFLVNRHKKKNQHFKKSYNTLDLDKSLITPIRIYQRNQFMKINSELLWRQPKGQCSSLNKYLPLKYLKNRYEL